jgi:hypothetical protein|tara:strand:+ start:2416 stop:2592 length:177 start_codon:yes stop_codon:yes gene_type:complete
MNKQKTIEERIINYSNHDSLERHMPKPSKKSFIAVCLLSPVLCLLAWGIAVYACISSD